MSAEKDKFLVLLQVNGGDSGVNSLQAHLGAGHPRTYWRSTVELPRHHPSHPGGSPDTGGPGRAGTAAAVEQLLGLTGNEEAYSVRGGERGVPDGAAPAAGAGGQVELKVAAEVGWEEATPLLDSERWRSGRGGGPGCWAEGRREVEPGKGGEAGAAGQGGRNRLRPCENPAPRPPQAWTGGKMEGSVAHSPPRSLAEFHAACGGDWTRGQRTGPEEAKVGPEEPQAGCASPPGIGPGPGDESQLWRPGFGWREM